MIERHRSKTLLLSEEKKFIFIHNYKVAGTSVRAALSPFQSEFYRYLSNLVWMSIPALRDKTPYTLSKHVDHRTIEQVLGSKSKDYVKFGFVRNPWDWEVSKYQYMLQNEAHFQHKLVKENLQTFSDYLDWRKSNHKTQRSFFENSSGAIEDVKILKIEDPQKTSHFLSSITGKNIVLPRKNTSNRTRYQDYYKSPADVAKIEELFKLDIDEFNYSFE